MNRRQYLELAIVVGMVLIGSVVVAQQRRAVPAQTPAVASTATPPPLSGPATQTPTIPVPESATATEVAVTPV
ncbi:MAG: hypothetical protein JXA33_19425, partial [Anaerolineae bacterium]|nr:hypothetical protein [Anaerolineae bacterium]